MRETRSILPTLLCALLVLLFTGAAFAEGDAVKAPLFETPEQIFATDDSIEPICDDILPVEGEEPIGDEDLVASDPCECKGAPNCSTGHGTYTIPINISGDGSCGTFSHNTCKCTGSCKWKCSNSVGATEPGVAAVAGTCKKA